MGPLYAVDSIVRKYIEHAKKNEEQIVANAPDGTYAAGVIRIQSLLPMLMVDILQNAPPEDNKVRWLSRSTARLCRFPYLATRLAGA